MHTLSRKRTQKDTTKDEPMSKNRRVGLKRYKGFCYICSLHTEILEKIIGYIPFWHIPRLRKSCKLMRSICDSVLLHQFQVSILQFGRKNPGGIEHAALEAIRDATWPYVSYGFTSTFCGKILPLIWNSDYFIPEPNKIKTFLKHFYGMVNDKCGNSNSQLSRLLYCLTLMGLLKKFKHSRLISSALIQPNYWRIVLELRGPWVGVLWSPKPAAEPHERAKLLMMLCEIMIADNTNTTFKYIKVWECDSEVFVFGNNAREKPDLLKNPTLVFTLKINAPKKIIALLKSCLEDEVGNLPQRLPRGEFLVSIDIACKEAMKWGCRQVHHIEVGPIFDAYYDYDEDEDVNLAETISCETIIVEST